MTDLGVAVRVRAREEQGRIFYRTYRNLWLWQQRAQPGDAGRTNRLFLMAVHWRARWSALAEIIEAEERRAAA